MVSFSDFQKLELVIAQIKDAKPHPNADRLFLLLVEAAGEEKQIVAGIRSTYSADELVGKQIVLVNNLEPAVIRGERSEGMLLAASSEAGPVLVCPERPVPTGSRVR